MAGQQLGHHQHTNVAAHTGEGFSEREQLHEAVAEGNVVDVIRLLPDRTALPLEKNSDGRDAIDIALANLREEDTKYTTILTELVARIPQPERPELGWKLTKLLHNKLPAELEWLDSNKNKQNPTPPEVKEHRLLTREPAAVKRDLRGALQLLKLNVEAITPDTVDTAEVDRVCGEWPTMLWIAVMARDTETIELLLEKGANPSLVASASPLSPIGYALHSMAREEGEINPGDEVMEILLTNLVNRYPDTHTAAVAFASAAEIALATIHPDSPVLEDDPSLKQRLEAYTAYFVESINLGVYSRRSAAWTILAACCCTAAGGLRTTKRRAQRDEAMRRMRRNAALSPCGANTDAATGANIITREPEPPASFVALATPVAPGDVQPGVIPMATALDCGPK